jgi:hypothetical protein
VATDNSQGTAMRANIDERLSTHPIEIKKTYEKTTWKDIALGIYIGGCALAFTTEIAQTIKQLIILNQIQIHMKNDIKNIFGTTREKPYDAEQH